MRRPHACLVLAAALLLSACGGGGGNAPVTSPTTVLAAPALTGTLVPLDNVFSELTVGHLDNGPERRVFVSFDLSKLPTGAVITDATLRFVQTSTVGAPDLAFGDFIIHSVDIGTSLTFSEDYGTSLTDTGQKLGSGGPANGPFEHDVTAWVQADLAHPRPFASFRITLTPMLNPPPGDHYVVLDDPTHIDYAGPATLTLAWTLP